MIAAKMGMTGHPCGYAPPEMTDMSTQPPGPVPAARTQRRLLGVAAGLGVAVIAGALFAVTYGDLKALALAGHASRRLAPAYPVMFDALVTVTVLALALAWQRRWWSRWSRWLLLLVLLAGAGGAAAQRAVQGYPKLPHTWVKAGVAVAPEVILLIAVWLWLGMFRHARSALAAAARSAERPPPGPLPALTPAPDPAVEPGPGPDLIPGLENSSEPRHELATEPAAPSAEEPPPAPKFTLPTDIRLVSKPEQSGPTATTRPDIVIPAALAAAELTDGPQDDAEPLSRPDEDRAEGPDAGEGAVSPDELSDWSAAAADDVRRWAATAAHDYPPALGPDAEAPAPPEDTPRPEDTPPPADTAPSEDDRPAEPEDDRPATEWPLPSSTFRSSPTPPDSPK